jgi:hypothetical protein
VQHGGLHAEMDRGGEHQGGDAAKFRYQVEGAYTRKAIATASSVLILRRLLLVRLAGIIVMMVVRLRSRLLGRYQV